MVRRVFFSFHYERDVWRAAQIRNSNVIKGIEKTGFYDQAEWEQLKRSGEAAIHNWIDKQLIGTSVTAVLIGPETSHRPYVQYEIRKSIEKGNGLLGIYIHNVPNQHNQLEAKGQDPLREYNTSVLYPQYKTYDWVTDNGYLNLGDWVELAARDANR